MQKKSNAKKSNKEMLTPKRFLPRLSFALFFGALIVVSVLGARTLLMNLPIFKIKEVSIAAIDAEPLANPADFFVLDSKCDCNLLSFDMKKVARDIRTKHPQLKNVYIRKQFPHKVTIVVEKRNPVAVIAGPNVYLIDEEGFILPFKSEYINLPKIAGIVSSQIQLYTKNKSSRINLALNLLKELKEAGVLAENKLSRIELGQYPGLVFFLENGIEVRMGQDDLKKKAVVLSRILGKLKADNSVPKYIDMRFDDPVVKP